MRRVPKFIATKTFRVVALAVAVLLFGSLSFSKDSTQKAQADLTAPSFNIQYGDATDVHPNLPSRCSAQMGQDATATTDDHDPDCLRVRITTDPDTQYTRDFRFCLTYNGRKVCTAWASESENYSSITPMTQGGNGGKLSGTMYSSVESRPVTDAQLPLGTTFSGVQVGVALAYQDGNNGCGGSSGMSWSTENITWEDGAIGSRWAFGESHDNDPGCFQAGMRINTINVPLDAQFVSSNAPTGPLTKSTAYNNSYNIVMKNLGRQWTTRVLNSASTKTVRSTDGHCEERTSSNPSGFDYSTGDQCHDYIILSSDRYRLERTDSTAVQVRSHQLRANSGDATYVNGQYNYSGPDTTITNHPTRSSANINNTLPFVVRQDVTYTWVDIDEEFCEPGNPNDIQPVSTNWFGIKTAQARSSDEGGINCYTVSYHGKTASYSPWNPNIQINETANFAPMNFTTPSIGQVYQLTFKMVDLQDLGNATGGFFGSPATINLNVVGDPPPPPSLNATSNVVTATISEPVYNLACMPGNLDVPIENGLPTGPVQFNARATTTTGFNSIVTLSATAPSGLTFNFQGGNTVNPTPGGGVPDNRDVTVTGTWAVGTYTGTVHGTSATGTPQDCTVQIVVHPSSIVDLRIEPNNAVTSVGNTVPYFVTATFADGNEEDVTDDSHVRYYSRNTTIATIPVQTPTATGVSVGSTQIYAVYTANDSSALPSNDANLTINAAPTGVDNVRVEPAACENLRVTWRFTPGGPTPTGFKVYGTTTATGSTPTGWGLIGTVVYDPSLTTYTYTSFAPVSQTVSNYYSVTWYTDSFESEKVLSQTNPIIPSSCGPDLTGSDKDVMSVSHGVDTHNNLHPVAEMLCSGASEQLTLPNNAIFQPGDTVTFQINVCNTDGTEALTGVTIDDTFTNLSSPVMIPTSCSVTLSGTSTSPRFTLSSDVPAGGVCSFKFSATVTIPSSTANHSLFTFQNKAIIHSNIADYPIQTQLYTFGAGSGVPVRNETAP